MSNIICVDNDAIFPDMASMHKRLRKARIDAGFTSARSAAIAHNWHVSTYSAHENGQNKFGADVAETYSKAFGVSAPWLLMGVEVAPDQTSGIDNQIRQLPPDEARAVIDRFNAILEGIRISKKLK